VLAYLFEPRSFCITWYLSVSPPLECILHMNSLSLPRHSGIGKSTSVVDLTVVVIGISIEIQGLVVLELTEESLGDSSMVLYDLR
jgi:hypothetical protein